MPTVPTSELQAGLRPMGTPYRRGSSFPGKGLQQLGGAVAGVARELGRQLDKARSDADNTTETSSLNGLEDAVFADFNGREDEPGFGDLRGVDAVQALQKYRDTLKQRLDDAIGEAPEHMRDRLEAKGGALVRNYLLQAERHEGREAVRYQNSTAKAGVSIGVRAMAASPTNEEEIFRGLHKIHESIAAIPGLSEDARTELELQAQGLGWTKVIEGRLSLGDIEGAREVLENPRARLALGVKAQGLDSQLKAREGGIAATITAEGIFGEHIDKVTGWVDREAVEASLQESGLVEDELALAERSLAKLLDIDSRKRSSDVSSKHKPVLSSYIQNDRHHDTSVDGELDWLKAHAPKQAISYDNMVRRDEAIRKGGRKGASGKSKAAKKKAELAQETAYGRFKKDLTFKAAWVRGLSAEQFEVEYGTALSHKDYIRALGEMNTLKKHDPRTFADIERTKKATQAAFDELDIRDDEALGASHDFVDAQIEAFVKEKKRYPDYSDILTMAARVKAPVSIDGDEMSMAEALAESKYPVSKADILPTGEQYMAIKEEFLEAGLESPSAFLILNLWRKREGLAPLKFRKARK